MKVTPTVVAQKQFTEVNLTLTPREAYVLAQLLGNLYEHEAKDIANKKGYSVNNGPGFPSQVVGLVSNSEAHNLIHMYFDIFKALHEGFKQEKS